MQYACPILSSVACPDLKYFSTLSHKRHDFRGKKLRILKYVFWYCLQILSETFHILRGGADKSLARPTSRCRRMESVVSLERGVCSCAELQVFSCYRGWKETCQATRAISTTSRRELSLSFFFLQGKAQKKIHAILAETLGENAPSYGTVKNWVAQFNLLEPQFYI